MSTEIGSTVPAYEPPELFKPVGSKELDKSDFMTLFITQMQHQDPLEPMDSYEMASQLAQFSNMEATMKMSSNMEKLLEYQTSQNNLQLLTLIDKDVQAYGHNIGVVDGKAAVTDFDLYDAADTCVVDIFDSTGRLVDSMDLGFQPSGAIELAWDAVNPKGDTVADGAYVYKVKAFNNAGQEIGVGYRTTGKVTGIDFESGQALLTIDNSIPASVAEILSVK